MRGKVWQFPPPLDLLEAEHCSVNCLAQNMQVKSDGDGREIQGLLRRGGEEGVLISSFRLPRSGSQLRQQVSQHSPSLSSS